METVHGRRWEKFRDIYDDWGREVAFYLGRQRGRLKIRELAELAGGAGYTAVGQSLRRVQQGRQRDKAWRRRIDAVNEHLSQMKM